MSFFYETAGSSCIGVDQITIPDFFSLTISFFQNIFF